MASTDVALTGDELEAAFNAAVSWVSNPEENAFSVPTPTSRQLILYGFYKQATKGDNNTAQPWMVQVTAVRSSDASYLLRRTRARLQHNVPRLAHPLPPPPPMQRQKWDAWESRKGLSKEEAMTGYGASVAALLPCISPHCVPLHSRLTYTHTHTRAHTHNSHGGRSTKS